MINTKYTHIVLASILFVFFLIDACIGFWILCQNIDQYTSRYALWNWIFGVFLFYALSLIAIAGYYSLNPESHQPKIFVHARRSTIEYIRYYVICPEIIIATIITLIALSFFIWGTYLYIRLSPHGQYDAESRYHWTLWKWFQVNYWCIIGIIIIQLITQIIRVVRHFFCIIETSTTERQLEVTAG